MKKKLLVVVILHLTILNSIAQLNWEHTQSFDFNNYLESFVPGDLNKDGNNDLVFSYSNQDYLAYRLNAIIPNVSPAPTFGDMKMIRLDKFSSKRKLLIGDINNDTFNDILFAEYDNSRIGLAINNGQSLYDEIHYFNTGSKPTKLLSGDFNNDQLNDLAVICEGSKQLWVYLGNTSALLSEGVSYSTTGTPSDMELRDINNDGYLDIMISDLDNYKLQLFAGNLNGTFTKVITVDTNPSPVNFEIADFNGDQLLDVVSVSKTGTEIQIFYQSVNHTFSLPTIANTIAPVSKLDFILDDLNSDGYIDMAIRGEGNQKIEFLLGKSGNQFDCIESEVDSWGQAGTPTGFYMKSVYSTNKLTFLNTNLSTDDVCENQFNQDFSLKVGAGGAVKCTNSFYLMQMADMTKDGIQDLIFNNYLANTLVLYYGKSDQTYQYIKNIPCSFHPEEVAIYDINLDGNLDIITSGNNKSEIMMNDGTNNFTHQVINGYGAGALAVLDANKNGNPDLFLNNNLYLDVKDGSFENVVHFDPHNLRHATPMDFNHDGNPDLACADYNAGKFFIYPGKDDGTFGPEVIINLRFSSMIVKDINQDGYDDIIGNLLDTNQLILFRNNKMGGFDQEILPKSEFYISNFFVLDFDNDGKNDIVTPFSNLVEYYPINADGSIGTMKTYPINNINNRSDMAVADSDGDGSPELFMLTNGNMIKYSNKITTQLGTDQLTQGVVKIYPVPAKDLIFVEDISQNIRIVNLLDVKGNKVKSVENVDQSKVSISVNDLPAGIYFLEVICKDQTRKRYKAIVK